jgi:RhtB (resistance to homoserine/threonine) family protein
MGVTNYAVFIGVAALIVLLPGPDTAVVAKNALLHGRRSGLATTIGVNVGVSVWTLAAAVGVASAVRASAVAFDVIKFAGALYLLWIGIQTLRSARSPIPDATSSSARASQLAGFRQGMLTNLGNPKVAVFFTSLLPQFVASGHAVFLPMCLLGATLITINVLWQCAYVLLAARFSTALRRSRVKATIDRITGSVLIAVGIRLATETR